MWVRSPAARPINSRSKPRKPQSTRATTSLSSTSSGEATGYTGYGAALSVDEATSLSLSHTTIADNDGGGGSGPVRTVDGGSFVIGGDGIGEDDKIILVSGTGAEGDAVDVLVHLERSEEGVVVPTDALVYGVAGVRVAVGEAAHGIAQHRTDEIGLFGRCHGPSATTRCGSTRPLGAAPGRWP